MDQQPTRLAATIDCFGTPCDTGANVCCLTNGIATCVPDTVVCPSSFQCFGDNDCPERSGDAIITGSCCAAGGVTRSPFGDAATSSATNLTTSCVPDKEASQQGCGYDQRGSLCNVPGTACTTEQICTTVTVDGVTLPFDLCE